MSSEKNEKLGTKELPQDTRRAVKLSAETLRALAVQDSNPCLTLTCTVYTVCPQ